MRLERPRRPHAGERPAVEVGRRRDGDRLARRQRDDVLPLEERRELVELLAAGRDQLARRRDAAPWCFAHAASGSPPFILPASERNASCVACSSRVAIAEQAVDRQRDAFLEPQLLLELVAARGGTRRARLRRDLGFEILDVGADRLRRLGLRVGEIAEQVQIVDVGERARQILVDELQRRRASSRCRP